MNTCSQPKCRRPAYAAPSTRPGKELCMDTFPLAMAYVPMQQFQSMYELDEALQNGTVFPELNKPFMGWKGGCSC